MDKITITNAKNCKLDGGVRATPTYMFFSNDEDNVPAELTVEVESLADVSDGYHSIQDLYDHRVTLFITLCKVMTKWITGKPMTIDESTGRVKEYWGESYLPWRSKKHSDGKPAYDGWFIMGISKHTGAQISYHLPLSRWGETDFAETLDQAPMWDGHTSSDVLKRLKNL